jgi:hypothetical protein
MIIYNHEFEIKQPTNLSEIVEIAIERTSITSKSCLKKINP